MADEVLANELQQESFVSDQHVPGELEWSNCTQGKLNL
jgi:hypothetical protein